MTIGKKLYVGFGAILAIILFLFVINIFAVMRQSSTRNAVQSTLNDVQTIENVRYKMMENRLSLGNYLLSGDLRDEGKTNKGITELQSLLKQSELRPTIPTCVRRSHRWKTTKTSGPKASQKT